MGNGIPILDTITKKCVVEGISKFTFRIILTQGLNRQIRRMCEHFGFRVRKLKRMRIMNLTLDNIKAGEWRHLTQHEMRELNGLLAHSHKTAPGYLPEKSETGDERKRASHNKPLITSNRERNRDHRRDDKRGPKKATYAYTPPKK